MNHEQLFCGGTQHQHHKVVFLNNITSVCCLFPIVEKATPEGAYERLLLVTVVVLLTAGRGGAVLNTSGVGCISLCRGSSERSGMSFAFENCEITRNGLKL